MKKISFYSLAVMIIGALVLTSCGSDNQKAEKYRDDDEYDINISIGGKEGFHLKVKDEDGENVNININGDDIEKGINELINSDDVELTDFRAMKALLPSSVAGLKRSSIEGQKSGIGKLKAATAEAVYRDGAEKIEISIVDAGGMGMMMSTMAGWANVEVDNESDHGYERTTKIDGYKAFESYDSDSKEGSVAVIVEDRIIVAISGENVSEKQIRKALNEVSFRKLKRLIP